MSQDVGWNLFHAISNVVHDVTHAADSVVRGFSHIMHDLGPFGVAAAAMLGLPEIAGAGMADLLMKDHAGHPEAQKRVQEVLARGGNWPTLVHQVAAKIKAHPDFKEFHAHVVAAKVHGVAPPPPPQAYSNVPSAHRPGRWGGHGAPSRGPSPGPSLAPQRQYPDDSTSPQDGDDGSMPDDGGY
jgi:hypothetical protein